MLGETDLTEEPPDGLGALPPSTSLPFPPPNSADPFLLSENLPLPPPLPVLLMLFSSAASTRPPSASAHSPSPSSCWLIEFELLCVDLRDRPARPRETALLEVESDRESADSRRVVLRCLPGVEPDDDAERCD